jgi:hypothetical protein
MAAWNARAENAAALGLLFFAEVERHFQAHAPLDGFVVAAA